MADSEFEASRFYWNRPVPSYGKAAVAVFCRRFHKILQPARVRSLHYLNFGCGPNVHTNFINLDYCWGRQIDICCDISDGLPLEAQSIDGIFTEHCLEHVTFEACGRVLKECRRIMRQGATLRIVVPDAGRFAELYMQSVSGKAVTFPGAGEFPAYTPMMHVNRIFRDYGHLFAYDAQTLAKLLETSGFTEVAPCSYRQGRDPKLLIDTCYREAESLYIEAYT